MSETPCHNCGRSFDVGADEHYELVDPEPAAPAVLYFCSASCVADNAGLYDE